MADRETGMPGTPGADNPVVCLRVAAAIADGKIVCATWANLILQPYFAAFVNTSSVLISRCDHVPLISVPCAFISPEKSPPTIFTLSISFDPCCVTVVTGI